MQITPRLQQINGMEIEVMEPLLHSGLRAKINRALGIQKSAVFLHGFNDPFQNFAKMIWPIYHRGYDIYAFNFPGHGNSEKIPEINWDILTDLAREYIVTYTPNYNLHIVSYSMGAAVGLRLAATNDDSALGLTRISMIAPYIYKLPPAPGRSMIGALKLAGGLSSKLVKYSHLLTDLPIMGDLVYLLPRYPFLLSQDPLIEVEKVKIPIVAMVFTGDEIIFADEVERTLAKFPNSKFLKYQGLSHNLYYEPPDTFDSIIQKLFTA